MNWAILGVWADYLLNSEFVSAMLGAGFAVLAANWYSMNVERNRVATEEVRSINSAIAVANAITNHSWAFKKQLAKPMIDEYRADRLAFIEHLKSMATGTKKDQPFHRIFDFRLISAFETDIALLRQIVIREASIGARAVQATMNLSQSIVSFGLLLDDRKNLIGEFESWKSSGVSDEIRFHRYFGLPDQERHDERYFDVISGIENQIDTMIYLSIFVAKKLLEKGIEVKAAHRKIGVKIDFVVWDEILRDEAFPKHEDFPDFNLLVVPKS